MHMPLNPAMLVLSLALAALNADAQSIDLGPDGTGFKRFLLYPHLQKGFEAMEQGNRSRALTEFEQARSLAPDNAVVAAYLAEAYRWFGERARAEALLREQLTRNPGNVQLGKALSDLRAELAAAPTPTPTRILVLARALSALPGADSTPRVAANLVPSPTRISTPTPVPVLVLVLARALSALASANPAPRVLANPHPPIQPKGKPRSRWALRPDRTLASIAGSNPGYFFADKAYKASAAGEFTSALPAAREAVRLAPENRAYGKLLVYVLAQSGLYEEANAMGCAGSSFTPACEVWPGEGPVDPARPAAESAYKAYGMRDYAVAAARASEAVGLAPANAPYRLLLVNALRADNQLAQAEQNASRFLSEHGDDAEMLAARSAIRQRLGQQELANEDAVAALHGGQLSLASEMAALVQLERKPLARERFAAATQEGLLKDQPDTNVAYLAVLVGDDESALAAFDRASAKGTLPDTARPDAAYAAGRLGRNDQALTYFKQTIDVAEVGQPFLTPQQLFNTRREVADRSRQWGANAALSYRGIAPTALAAAQPGASNDSLQAGAEVWWRPLGYRDGRSLELYAGLSETLSSKAGFATGTESLQGALGARVKPLADINLVLALERRFAIGSKTTTDWLPRVAYSAGAGTDLRVDVPGWMTATMYAEAGRFIKQHQTYATFEGQVGRSFRLDSVSPRLVILPHAVLGADYNSSLTSTSKSAVGAGVGVTLRHWFNEDRYNAPRSYADLSLQYRGRISGDDRAKGVFLRATLNF